LRAVTIGLLAAYLLAALGFARPGQVADFGWPTRFGFGPGLLLAVLVLYGVAWVLGSWSGKRGPRHAGWRGAVYGVLALLTAVVLAGGWNAAQEIVRFAPFPGTTAADFYRHVGDCCYDYIVKPLAYIMPLGSLVASLLGWWAGRRAVGASN
jgi:hypothetical protein